MTTHGIRPTLLLSVAEAVCCALLVAACGTQGTPVLSSTDVSTRTQGESEKLTAKTLGVVRSSDEDLSSSGGAVKVEVFAKKIEPLTLQKGGSVKVFLPLNDIPPKVGFVKAVDFVSESLSLKGSSIQGKILNVVVAEDASEGRHEGRVIVRFDSGREFAQAVTIQVIP